MGRLLTPAQRDRSRSLLMVVSGASAAVAVAATGGVSALAARETARADAEKARAAAVAEAEAARRHHEQLLAWAADHPVVVTTPRPTRTVVDPRVVVRAAAPGSAAVGGVTVPEGQAPAPPAPAPPPPPPPVTSTGS